MKVHFTTTVCVDGVVVTREFDAEDEAVEVLGEAMWRKLQNPEAVVTILVGPPTTTKGSLGEQPRERDERGDMLYRQDARP